MPAARSLASASLMVPAALLGGVFIGVLSALPVVNIANCCCLWILGGGALSSYLLQQNDPRPISAVRGAAVGLLAGVVGAFVWLILSLMLDVFIAPLQERMIAGMMRNAQDMPPDVRVWFDSMSGQAASPLRFVFGFTFQLFAGAVFSTLGGVLGASMLHRRAADVMPPPLPPQT